VIDKLQSTFNGCGWFSGTPSFTILNFNTDADKENVLCESGTEHLYALSVSSKQVVDWIMDGSVKSGKVLLVKARHDLDKLFSPEIDNNNFGAWSEERMEEIYAANAEVVVFYCNNASSNSPGHLAKYHAWVRKKHPESKQRCVMLSNGINGLFYYMRYKRSNCSEEEMDIVFKNRKSYRY
jgi:hypothetical protein